MRMRRSCTERSASICASRTCRFFVLDRNLGRELVLLDGALLLDGGVAARIGGLVCAPQQGFARLGLERA
jgi:hypothetical protein